MYEHLIEEICKVENEDRSWEDKAAAVYKAFEDAGALEELEEFCSWFGENEIGDFIAL